MKTSWPTIFVPIVTSFNHRGDVFIEGTKNIISFLYDQGIHGIWLLGSYGSFPLLSSDERIFITTEAVNHAQNLGMRTIVNVGAPATRTAVELAQHAEKCGADAVAAVVPFYYSSTHYRLANNLEFFSSLVENVRIPVIYYNNAGATGFSPSNHFIRELAKIGIAGIKDKGDFVAMAERCQEMRRHQPDAIYLSGATSVHLQGHLVGADGVTSGTALAAPKLVTGLQAALDDGAIDEALRIQKLILKVRVAMGRYAGRAVSAYDALAHFGIDAGTCRSPWLRLTEIQAREVIQEIDQLVAEL